MPENYTDRISEAIDQAVPPVIRTAYTQINTFSGVNSVSNLLRTYNVQNSRILNAKDNNPYDSKIPQGTAADKELYKSALGTPVLADITFKGGTYTDYNNRQVTFPDVRLVTVLVNVSLAKRVKVTEIEGRDGTVKEYIGKDDYQVNILGILTGSNGRYPVEEVRTLKQMLDAPISIGVVSRYLQNLDIYNLVVTDWAMDQEPGGYSQQNFSINCISDVPVELQIQ